MAPIARVIRQLLVLMMEEAQAYTWIEVLTFRMQGQTASSHVNLSGPRSENYILMTI